MGIGLVLGGGGVVGIAWEIGVLAGLAEELGWDPAGATTIVGTSAGSVVGTQLLHGATLDDLVAGQQAGTGVRGPGGGHGAVGPAGRDAAGGEGAAGGAADPDRTLEIFRMWAGAEAMDTATAREIAERAAAAASLDEERWVGSFSSMFAGMTWPLADLRVTAVSSSAGTRVVWTSASEVGLVRAVASSCAVPGLFPPVTIGADRFVDGGLWSASNADVLLGTELDTALYIGPMGVGTTGLARFSARALARESAALAQAGTRLHVVEPGERFRTSGITLMDAGRRVEGLEIGLADGKEAAARLAGVLG